jgi:hypothetical protein
MKKPYHIDRLHPGGTLYYLPSSRAEMEQIAQISGGTVGSPSKAFRADGRRYHQHLVEVVEMVESQG